MLVAEQALLCCLVAELTSVMSIGDRRMTDKYEVMLTWAMPLCNMWHLLGNWHLCELGMASIGGMVVMCGAGRQAGRHLLQREQDALHHPS